MSCSNYTIYQTDQKFIDLYLKIPKGSCFIENMDFESCLVARGAISICVFRDTGLDKQWISFISNKDNDNTFIGRRLFYSTFSPLCFIVGAIPNKYEIANILLNCFYFSNLICCIKILIWFLQFSCLCLVIFSQLATIFKLIVLSLKRKEKHRRTFKKTMYVFFPLFIVVLKRQDYFTLSQKD